MATQNTFGKYQLIRRLGGGGMAEVFHARLSGPGGFAKDVALKLILPHFSDDPEFVRLFIREATLAARLDHGNIVRIHEFDQIEGRHYIAMELVDGPDLRKLLIRSREKDRPIQVIEALLIASEVCQGLAFAHGELGSSADAIIHRDISPHNIIISRSGEVKISDFGIAKMATAAGVTETGMIRGKAAYMSPEQALGEDLDPRSDLFSLGCVIWETLAGQRLFNGSNDMRILERIKSMPIVKPSAYNPEVPSDVDELVLHCLERDPDKRVVTASELARRLGASIIKQQGAERALTLGSLVRQLDAGGVARKTDVMPAAVRQPVESPVASETETTQKDEVSEHRSLRRRGGSLWSFAALVLVILPLLLWFAWPDPVSQAEGVGRAGDAGSPDAGSPDAGSQDAGSQDAGSQDAGSQDAGSQDAETKEEALVASSSDEKDAQATHSVELVKKPSSGYLYLNAIPWAQVFFRGRLLGETPLEGTPLPTGKHQLTLKNPSSGTQRRVDVRIRAGRKSSYTFDLR